MITGQHVSTHGVWMNGVPLPEDAPSIAMTLRQAGYKTALLGKAHFEPLLDPFLRFAENRMGRDGTNAEWVTMPDGTRVPHRGFDHMEFAGHGAAGNLHYVGWLRENHPETIMKFVPNLDADLEVTTEPGGDTGAVQVRNTNDINRD